MSSILQDLSTPNLVSVIEGNLFELFSTFGNWPRLEVHAEPDVIWTMTDIPFPLFNSIVHARLAPERIDAVIESLTSKANSRKVPLLWWTGPATQPSDLGRHLERHGFFNGGQVPGMAVDLGKLKGASDMPEGVTIEQAKDDETIKTWCQVMAQGFEMPDFVAEAFSDFMHYADPNTIRAYLGWFKGKPVATSFLSLTAGAAGIYNVVTLPEARRKGIGARMTELPLLEAKALGYKAGILHASGMGADIYRSLGFQEYCTIGQYIYSPQ